MSAYDSSLLSKQILMYYQIRSDDGISRSRRDSLAL